MGSDRAILIADWSMVEVEVIPARRGKALKLGKGQKIKVGCRAVLPSRGHLRSAIWPCISSLHRLESLVRIVQVINGSGSQVVDTWAFNADNLKVGVRSSGSDTRMSLNIRAPCPPVLGDPLTDGHLG